MVTRRCRFCAGPAGDAVLDLGDQPDSGYWPRPGERVEAYPLAMWCCPRCGLAQLAEGAPPIVETVGAEPRALVEEATRLVGAVAGVLPASGRVREFGSPHGGSWLPELTGLGLTPVCEGQAEVVVDSLGLMHEPHQDQAIRDRARALAAGGTLLIFFHSLAAIVTDRQWNDLRHGHFAYYSLAVLGRMLERHDLVAVDAVPSRLYGGSFLLIARHRSGPTRASARLLRCLAEEDPGLADPEVLRGVLQPAADAAAEVLRRHLQQARLGGRRVYGYAAASRAVALLNLAGADPELLAAVADAAPSKQGRLVPGTGIEVIPPERLLAARPHEVLVLLPEVLPEVLSALPELSGRFVPYQPGASRIGLPDRRVDQFQRSLALQEKLHDLVPGGAHTYARGSDQYPADRAPVFVRGQGALAWDADNNCFIEYGIGLRSVTLGHADPEVDAWVRRCAADGVNFSRPSLLEGRVAELFCARIPAAERVKFAKNGSDVTTAAVRLARAATGRDLVAIADQSFFSVDDWWIAHTPMDRGIPAVVRGQGITFGFNDLGALHRLFDEYAGSVGAVIMQPATPTADPLPGYLEGVRELCCRHGTVLIFDEIVTGYRWGPAGVQGLTGVAPDLACWAKGIGNGYPIAALTGRAELLDLGGLRTDQARPFTLSTTYGPESVGLGAVEAVARAYVERDPIGRLTAAGRALAEGINAVVDTAGLGDFLGATGHPACLMFFTRDADGAPSQEMRTVLLGELIGHGVIGQSLVTCAAHDDPVLIEHTIAAFAAALPAYHRALERGAASVLTGPPVAPALRSHAEPRRLPARRL